MNLVMLLDKMEELIDKAPEIPLTGRVLLDSDDVLDLVDKIRNSLPDEVRKAEMVSTEKDRVISEGQQKAERMISQAEEYANKLIQDHEITRQAQQEADRILDESRAKAEEMEEGARSYAQDILANLQNSLEKTLTQVNRGKEELENREQPDSREEVESRESRAE